MAEKQLQKKISSEIENHSLTRVAEIQIDKSKPVTARIEEYLNKVKNPRQLLCGDTPVELLFAAPEAPALSALVADYFINKKRDN